MHVSQHGASSLESQSLSTIELDESLLVEVFIAGLGEVAFGFEEVVLGLVELGDGRLALLVLGLRQAEGRFAALAGLVATDEFLASGYGIIISLLNFFVERFLRIVERQLLVVAFFAGRANAVAHREAVEDRHIEAETQILTEVVLYLLTEILSRKARSLVVVAAQSGAETERGIETGLCYLDAALGRLEAQLLCLYLGFDA